jgi:hypothetical protein
MNELTNKRKIGKLFPQMTGLYFQYIIKAGVDLKNLNLYRAK